MLSNNIRLEVPQVKRRSVGERNEKLWTQYIKALFLIFILLNPNNSIHIIIVIPLFREYIVCVRLEKWK